MTTTILTENIRYTLTAAQFETALRKGLAADPDIAALQEAGPNRNPIIQRVANELGYAWTRPEGGGEPVLWKRDRYQLRSCKPIRLARAEFVGHLAGRKDRLPESIATEVLLDDLASKRLDGEIVAVLVFHLTAEVQMGAGYRKDPAHLLRVLRHRREKRRLGRRGRMHQRHGRTVYLVGDSNFDGFTVGHFVSCWDHRSGGTLGPRAVDVVLAGRRALKLWTIETASDHDALVVTYP